MTVEIFLTLLSIFSATTGLIVEAVKKLVEDKFTISYNFVALVVALIVGVGGTFIYYILTKVPVSYMECVYAFLMGISSGLCSMLGFDKIKQLIEQMRVF